MAKTFRCFLTSLAATLIAANMSLAGGDADLPAPDPPGHWRYITQDAERTTSQCIGDPKTPLCAMETVWACYVRNKAEFCAIVGVITDFVGTTPVEADEFSRYRILSSRRLKEEDIPAYKKEDGKWSWKEGDVQIVIDYRDCNIVNCIAISSSVTHTMRWLGNGWIEVSRESSREQ